LKHEKTEATNSILVGGDVVDMQMRMGFISSFYISFFGAGGWTWTFLVGYGYVVS
jgi:hypothetical protein